MAGDPLRTVRVFTSFEAADQAATGMHVFERACRIIKLEES
ncbi:MAG TPA: hypothetical protein VGR95_08235 [Thermoanaerobaculia bacterium]|jgi:hypothetical protein|nr:hypothetical protein [Thermoanaerobaculia bacterium]